jgi:hypothetical protein
MEHRGLTFSWPFPNPVSDLQGLIAIPKVFSQGQHFGHAAVKVSKLRWQIKINKSLTLLIWAVREETVRCKDVVKPVPLSRPLSRFSASNSPSNFSIRRISCSYRARSADAFFKNAAILEEISPSLLSPTKTSRFCVRCE